MAFRYRVVELPGEMDDLEDYLHCCSTRSKLMDALSIEGTLRNL